MKHAVILALLLVPGLAQAIPEGPAYPSAEWLTREATNYATVLQAPIEEASNPAFVIPWTNQSVANALSLTFRDLADPSWLLVSTPLSNALLAAATTPAAAALAVQNAVIQIQANPANAIALPLNTPVTPLCTSWVGPCSGDPFRYPGTDSFYTNEADVFPVVFYDDGCARISGRVWAPRGSHAGSQLPAVVIENGSVQAPEPLYWWMAQLLVRNGYAVMTFDPRGQGRSDEQTPTGGQGSNIDSSVFWTGLVNAIDFFRSSTVAPYPHNIKCAGTYPTAVAAFNPLIDRIDPNRLGIAGHSLGAQGVSIVQGYGAPGADPWPGKMDVSNPVKVVVAWDSLSAPSSSSSPKFGIRVPAMGQSSEYGLAPKPFTQPPDAEEHKVAYEAWKKAGMPIVQIIVRGSSHFEWSQIPGFPASSWCPKVENNRCVGGWGNPLAQHYSLAWFDRWLKNSNEVGYSSADARLLDDDGEQGRNKMSFYYRSARSFKDRSGKAHGCEDIRAGCTDTAVDSSVSGSGSGGGAMPGAALWTLAFLALISRFRRRRQA
jgi:pimeloyl-ACP methyl ester carboxylesterase